MAISTLEKIKKKTESEIRIAQFQGDQEKLSKLNQRLDGIDKQIEYVRKVLAGTDEGGLN